MPIRRIKINLFSNNQIHNFYLILNIAQKTNKHIYTKCIHNIFQALI